MTPLSWVATRGFPTCGKIYGNSLFASFKSFRIILLPPLLLPPRSKCTSASLAPRSFINLSFFPRCLRFSISVCLAAGTFFSSSFPLRSFPFVVSSSAILVFSFSFRPVVTGTTLVLDTNEYICSGKKQRIQV